MNAKAEKWIKFLRQYGPIARNDNMYDETIQRSARRAGIKPIIFEHPYLHEVRNSFDVRSSGFTSVILTGTAGDGKTHLCRQVWERLGGSDQSWDMDNPYLPIRIRLANSEEVVVHFIRDLSAWVPQRGLEWDSEKEALLQRFCQSLFEPDPREFFLIAANDGQLVETWRRLKSTVEVERARQLFEILLVENRQQETGVRLKFFNLSRGKSADLFDHALDAFLAHDGWKDCLVATQQASFIEPSDPTSAFGPKCPIRRNYELLQNPLVRKRLRALFELCDFNDLHIPIRQILLLLSNAVLGHPDVRDHLMVPADVPKVIQAGTVSRASLYNNIFGGNLSENRRETLTVFDYLDRFRIGYETSNRVDNILIFGESDDTIRPFFTALLEGDTFYGADEQYKAAQHEYVEGAEEDDSKKNSFLQQLIVQRRGLFFKIPEEHETELKLWELTVFSFAGEYLTRVVDVLKNNGRVERLILARLVKGLNRIFTGMFVASDQYLYLATSLSFSNAKVSRMLEARISVKPDRGERIEILLHNGAPTLNAMLSDNIQCLLRLNLTRYEFLSRVAEGALPSSFSKECYEDTLAFKSRILASLAERRKRDGDIADTLTFRLLSLDDNGNPIENAVEVRNA
jgi:hypothetical protein